MKNLNKLIVDLKYKAYTLKKAGQIPSLLYYRISLLNPYKDKEDYVKKLMFLTEHYLRVKGYYFKYKDIENDTNCIIENELKSFING